MSDSILTENQMISSNTLESAFGFSKQTQVYKIRITTLCLVLISSAQIVIARYNTK